MKAGTHRRESGATMGVVIVCSFVLVLIIVGLFYITLFIGGEDETRNATQAGTLNVGKHVFTDAEFKVTLPDTQAAEQFKDVLDKDGKVGLANINRIWGKALLAEANAEQMQSIGLAGSSKTNADNMFDAASQINNQLFEKLNNKSNLYKVFENLSSQNSVRMLGNDAKVTHEGAWGTSYCNRGEVSNIEVPSADILPSTGSHEALKQKDNRIPGYTSVTVGGKKFSFVPFMDKEKTHLISKGEFDSNSASTKAPDAPDGSKAIPNAFSCQGHAINQKALNQAAVGFVLTNPQRLYKLSMPHTFVRIKLEKNTLTWLFNSPTPPVGDAVDKLVDAAPDKLKSAQDKLDHIDTKKIKIDHDGDGNHDNLKVAMEQYSGSYPFRPDIQSKTGTPVSAVCGTLMANGVTLGKEYLPPCLDTQLFGSKIESGNEEQLEQVLVNRMNQMTSETGKTFTKKDLHEVLKSKETGLAMQADMREYIMYSPDGKDVEVHTKEVAMAKCSWLAPMINEEPDGTEGGIAKLTSFFPLAPLLQVSVIPDPYCFPYFPPFGLLYVVIDNKWKPGSGYKGCLGTVTSKHHTDIYLWGIAGP